MADDKFDAWAIVEIMGHVQVAGRVSEALVAGQPLLRVDVPDEPEAKVQAFTRYYGPQAIYALTVVTEEAARAAVRRIQPRPITVWGVETDLLERVKQLQSQHALPAGAAVPVEDDADYEPY